jgi:hypothetical protein
MTGASSMTSTASGVVLHSGRPSGFRVPVFRPGFGEVLVDDGGLLDDLDGLGRRVLGWSTGRRRLHSSTTRGLDPLRMGRGLPGYTSTGHRRQHE